MATATTSAPAKIITGGSFLIEERQPSDIFTPEDFSDEQRQIAETAAQFAANEVLPAADDIEAKHFDVTRGLLKKAGDLGLMAVDVPEAYGGLAMDKVTSAIIADRMSVLASFSVAFSAHVGIGTLPIVWYGTDAQKEKYLPKLATGEWIAAYALSEASSGSDAMNIRCRAVLSDDGKHYILNGEKMWITNAGFADLYTVFAKIADPKDPESKNAQSQTKMSAFLIERNTPGLTVGAEEHKLGIRGSSTCPLILSDCKVPAENLLGEAGKGHHIAFNILNIGRFKLGAACLGGARTSLGNGIKYAKDRKAFGKSISDFGLIQQKLADSTARIFVGEAMTYRTVGMIDAALATIPESEAHNSREIQKRIEEYAVECSILKVWGSEMLDAVVDHVVQIYAGYGYVEEYPAERAYRDARINRIFEGTNEINRLIITGFLMKRAMTGQLPLLAAIKQLMDEVMSPPAPNFDDTEEDALAREAKILANAKKIALLAAGAASQKYMNSLADQQEIMADLADMLIEIYAVESAILRARKMRAPQVREANLGDEAISLGVLATQYYTAHAMTILEPAARRVLAAVAEGDMLRTQLAILRRLVKHEPADTIQIGRALARQAVETGKYPL